jgi:hypothetical protein
LVGEGFFCLFIRDQLDLLDDALVKDMLGLDFDYSALPVVHTCGGILVAWDASCWSVSSPILCTHSLSVKVAPRVLMVNSCIKVHLDLQADKSPVLVKGPFYPRVVNPRYRIRGTNV